MRIHINFLPILTVPLYYDSPGKFSEKLKKKFSDQINRLNPSSNKLSDKHNETYRLLKNHFDSVYPNLHKFNNILGYAELMLDGNDVLIYFYFNGDQRKRYNQEGNRKNNTRAIFHPLGHDYGGKFREQTNSEFRSAIKKALLNVEKQCKVWNVFVDVTYYVDFIEYFDFESYITHMVARRNQQT